MHGMENRYMGIRWVFFITCKQSGGQSVFHFHLIPASNRIGRGSRGRALARRLAANAVDANQPSGRGFDRPSFRLLCRGGHTTLPQCTLSSGKDTSRSTLDAARHGGKHLTKLSTQLSPPSTPPPTALFLRPSVNKKLLSLTASQVCPLKAHASLKLSAGPQRNALCTLCTRETHNSPPRETFKCAFFPPPVRKTGCCSELVRTRGGEAALEKVPLVLIRGDNVVRVRQRGADS